jgi:hypothetical protein
MQPELQQQLFDKYPKIFADKSKPSSESSICFGIQTNDGWYWLIDQLCAELERYTKKGHPQVVAFQIKEKFGMLRFYAHNLSDTQSEIIHFAENMSATICEKCGSTKETETKKISQFLVTLCKKCHSSYNNK